MKNDIIYFRTHTKQIECLRDHSLRQYCMVNRYCLLNIDGNILKLLNQDNSQPNMLAYMTIYHIAGSLFIVI